MGVKKTSFRCINYACCLYEGHGFLHSYKCAAKGCPGYTWKASEDPHPELTCGTDRDQGVLPGCLDPAFFWRYIR